MHLVCPGRSDNITLHCLRVFLVTGVLQALLELLEQKVTWASKVHQVHVDPGARQDLMVYAANVVNQAIPALTEPLALLASKENRYQLDNIVLGISVRL